MSQMNQVNQQPAGDTPIRRQTIVWNWLTVVVAVAGFVVCGVRLRRLLDAIPDSNDDFIFF
jgi:hypothetical protein